LIIWHGGVQNANDAKTLEVIERIVRSLARHGFAGNLISAGQDDWSGWHLSGPGNKELLGGVAYTATVLADPSWEITVEP
jgi:hypothetical protein